MKRIIPIMVILCIGLAGFVVYSRMYSDRTGPVIYFDESSGFVYRDGMTNEELLTGVTALDDRDGDVSDTLEIESVYESNEQETVITYAAKDRSMNISKARRIVATVSDEPAEEGTANSEGQTEEGTPESPDSEASDTPEAAEVSVSEKNEAARAEQEAQAEAMDSTAPKIYLTDYVVELPLGAEVDRLSYVKEITDDADDVNELWHKISIVGDLDTSVAGTYENTYFVTDSQQNTSNLAVIRFVVG